MKLIQLFEASGKHITFCFGRMNPPTIGHEQVFKTMEAQGGEYKIFVSQTQDKKDNPLDYKTKTDFIKKIHPDYAKHLVVDASLNTVMKVASYLYEKGYTSATFVAGSDRLESFEKLLTQYNGVEGKAHGFYNFQSLEFVSSGDREDGAEGVAGVSASGARAAAREGNQEAFAVSTGAGGYSDELYTAVRAGLGVKEDQVSEMPIQTNPEDPMDPMIVGTKANPAKLKYRMMRAASQLKDLAARADNASPMAWQTIAKHFKELAMNIDEIEHGLDELAKQRRKGGVRSRGIDPMIDSIDEGWKSKMAGAALAAANLLGSPAQAAEKPITIAYVMIDGEVRKYNLGDRFENAKEAEQFITKVLDKQGLQGYTLDIKHGYPKKKLKDSRDNTNETIKKVGDKYQLVSKSKGKNLGTYDTKAAAEKRERQVQYFKHKG
jgi:hypothetical protein